MKFFLPRLSFFSWMASTFEPGQIVYDVGAGYGHVSTALLEHTELRLIPMDFRPHSESPHQVMRADATTFDYQPGAVVLLCRPCHGFFVEEVISHALLCGVREFVYIGFGKNLRNDLSRWLSMFHLAKRNVGMNRECAWLGGRRANVRP